MQDHSGHRTGLDARRSRRRGNQPRSKPTLIAASSRGEGDWRHCPFGQVTLHDGHDHLDVVGAEGRRMVVPVNDDVRTVRTDGLFTLARKRSVW